MNGANISNLAHMANNIQVQSCRLRVKILELIKFLFNKVKMGNCIELLSAFYLIFGMSYDTISRQIGISHRFWAGDRA